MMQKKSSILLVAAVLFPAEALLHYQKLNVNIWTTSRKASSGNLQMRLNPSSFKGTDYTITEFPRPALRRIPNAPVVDFDDAFESKTKQMLGVMYEAKGVGLAAPQVGFNENFFVYNPFDSTDMERIVCNPTITKYSEETIVDMEGCLSLRSDECAGQVSRAAWIETEYQNELGNKVRRRLKDFEARVFQHEYDHLKGILCYDRFPPEDREAVQEQINNLLGLYASDDALVEPDADAAKFMQPRPLSAKWMPPLEAEESANEGDDMSTKRKRKVVKPSGGFGAKPSGGFGGGGEKKEKKKKAKTRNALRSSDPRFKSTGKTPFSNRK